MRITLPETIRGPILGVSAIVAGLVGFAGPETLLLAAKAIFASAPQIFTGVTVGALTLPEFLPPTSIGDYAGLGATALFAVYLGYRVKNNFDERGL